MLISPHEPRLNEKAANRMRTALVKTMSDFPAATISEKIAAVYGLARVMTETAIEISHPAQRAENKKIMRETLALILMETLDEEETLQ